MSTPLPQEFQPFSVGDSVFRLIEVAIERNRQLVRGAPSRLEPDFDRRKNTSIALEEVRQGLVPFADGRSELRSESYVPAAVGARAVPSRPSVEARQALPLLIGRRELSRSSAGEV